MKQIGPKNTSTSTGPVEHELKYILNVVLEFVNNMGTMALTYGVCVFFYQNHRHHHGNLLKKLRNQGCCKVLFLVVMSIVLCIPMLLLPPIFLSLWWREISPYNAHRGIGIVTVAMDWIDFLNNLFTKVAMIVATFYVKEEWSSVQKELQNLDGDRKLYDLIHCYKRYGRRVSDVQNVFQAWFLAKWLLYFTGILMFGTSALTQLTHGTKSDNKFQVLFDYVHLLHNVMAFIIIYVCGSLMTNTMTGFMKK